MEGEMSSRLEKRLSRIEQRLLKRTEEARVCICRLETRFHSGNCLEAILKGMSRVCPLHGFRDLGFFFCAARPYRLGSEEDQFCPCPPHPWRSFVLSKSHTWEEHNVAREACNKFPADEHFNFKEDHRRIEEAVAEYASERQKWVKSGMRLPSKHELVKLQWKRARTNVDRESTESL